MMILFLLFVGKHPDLIIDQRKISNGEQQFHVGDFISYVDVNGFISSPTRTKKLFETRISNDNLQV